jgi:4-amino-4-deoxy-L-arabinose transferase-like glycosyltransferase
VANDRAQRRRQQHHQVAPPRPSRGLTLPALPSARILLAVWALATLTLLVLTALGIERKITWYLAVDQYGYLAFAHDLMNGKIFHHWPPLDALAPQLPPRVDMLVQTYVWDAGKLYCRYAPGFPIILAGWLTLFGDDGAHYLNPTIFILLLVLLTAFQARLFKSVWRGTIGTALVVLFPTTLHLWSLTLTRELATYLTALLGLLLLLPREGRPLSARRVALGGLALGFAGSIRPEALIYLLPAVLLALLCWWRERPGTRAVLARLAAGVFAVFVGLTPFLAYNWAATGSPFRPTQGMEIPMFAVQAKPPPLLPPPKPNVGFPPGAWRGGTVTSVQGGGLRLAHLPETLPGNVAIIRAAFGDLMLLVALLGALVAAVRRRELFVATVPYMILALLFYSCWSKPDARYLVGIFLFLPLLMIEGSLGALDLAHDLARRDPMGARSLAFGLSALVLLGVLLLYPSAGRGALPALTVMFTAVVCLAGVAAGVDPRQQVTTVAAPVLALALVGLVAWRAPETLERRASFQRPEMLRARQAFNKVVRPGAVVITTEDVGRPAENIDYYSGVARALYFTDLDRWRMSVGDAAALLAKGGMVPYIFVPTVNPARGELLSELSSRFSLELAADIPAAQAMNYFVAAAFHRGMHMELYRLVPLPGPSAPSPPAHP